MFSHKTQAYMLVEECEDTNPENTLKTRKRAAGTTSQVVQAPSVCHR